MEKLHNFKISGLVCAPSTPFKENGDVDLAKIPSYIDHVADFGIRNLFITGSIGEGIQMTVEERKQVMSAIIKAASGKMSAVIVHVGASNLRDSQTLAAYAQDIGADAIACIGPIIFKPASMDAYVDYMRQVASAAPNLPFYLYDFDILTGLSYDVSHFFAAAEKVIPTLRGAKHTSANFINMSRAVYEHNGKYDVIAGTEEAYIEALAVGVEFTTICSFYGHVLNRLHDAFLKGDLATARLEQKRIIEVGLIRKKYCSSFPESAKAISKAIGIDLGDPRPPLNKVSEETVSNIKKELQEIGFFEWGMHK